MDFFWSRSPNFSPINKPNVRNAIICFKKCDGMGNCIAKKRKILFLEQRFHLYHLNASRSNILENISDAPIWKVVILPYYLPYTGCSDNFVIHGMNEHNVSFLDGKRQLWLFLKKIKMFHVIEWLFFLQ